MIVHLKTPKELQAWRSQLNGSLGFVPTMGALHAGHKKLIQCSVHDNDHTLLSLFVNPTQFNDPKDFEKYPISLEKDLSMAIQSGVSAVFYPTKEALYPDDYHYRLSENQMSQILCGASRPGHFDGVLTVVMKLFQLARPNKVYFGEKDAQQLELIQGMVKAFFMDLEIIPVPTVREKDGLAMSSRNVRLSPAERTLAPSLYKIISTATSEFEAAQALKSNGFKVDYVKDLKGRRYAAVFLGETRLIDNVEISK